MKRDSQRGSVLLAVVLALSLIGAVALLLNRGTTMNLQSSAGRETADVAGAAAEAALNHAVWQAQQSNCVNYVNFSDQPFGSTGYQAAFSPVYTTSITPVTGSPVLVKAKGVLQKSGTTRELSRRARVYEPSTTVTLQLGTDPGKDTMLDSWYNTRNHGRNYGGVSTSSSQLQHQLYQFDLPDIPSGVTIFSAQLAAYAYYISSSGPAESINLHRVTRDWLEGTKAGGGIADGATWDTYDGVNPWTVPGGDFDPVSLASAPVLTTNQKWFSWSIIPLVSQWLEQPASNMGVLLKGTGNFWVEFASTEYNVPNQRPKLTITYACECGVVCGPPEESCNADYSPNAVQDEFSSSAVGAADVQAITYLPEGISFNSVAAPAGGAWILIDPVDNRFYMTDTAGTLLTSLAIPISSAHGGVFIGSGTYADHLALTNTSGGLVYIDMDGNNVSGTLVSGSSQASGMGFVGTSSSGTYDDHILILDRSSETVLIRTQESTAVTSFSVNDGTAAGVQDVKHLPGTDKVIITYSPGKAAIYDFSGSKLREYDLSGFGVTLAESTAINPLTCEHVVADRGSDRVIYLNTGKTGPIAHWKLDETSGLTAIDSVGGHDGTLLMGQTWGAGQIDGGLFFDGFDDYISVPHAETLSLTGKMTFAAWINTLDTSGGYRCILATDVPGNGMSNYWFGIGNDELTFGFFAEGSFRTVSTPSSNLLSDRWYHLAASFDDDTDEVRLYVDGGEAHVGAIAFAPTTETADVWIGHSVDGEYWTGSLDDIRIYNTVLSAAEISALADGGGGPQTVTLNSVADTYIDQNSPASDYGSDSTMITGADVSWDLYRTLVRFDVSTIPAGATVSAATLRLYIESETGNQDSDIGVYAITAPWDEATATWSSEAGGAFDPAQELAATLVPWNAGWVEWTLPVGLIHEWVDGITDNDGLLLNYQGTKKNQWVIFASREHGTINLHPELVIEYTEP